MQIAAETMTFSTGNKKGMNMEMYVSGDFDQQAGMDNCATVHPQI